MNQGSETRNEVLACSQTRATEERHLTLAFLGVLGAMNFAPNFLDQEWARDDLTAKCPLDSLDEPKPQVQTEDVLQVEHELVTCGIVESGQASVSCVVTEQMRTVLQGVERPKLFCPFRSRT